MPDSQKIELIVTLENGQLKVAAKETEQAIDKMGKGVESGSKAASSGLGGIHKSLNSLTTLAKGFLGLQIVQFFVNIGKSAFKAAADLEKNKIALEVLLGSSSKAEKMTNDIMKFAAATPYMSEGLMSSAQTMLNFGIAAEEIMPNLNALGDIAGGNQQKFDALTLAFSQTTSTGRLMGQDLLQMINAGFNPLQIISEKTGKSMGQLKDEMSKGSISADMVRDAFISATSEGGKFYGMMSKQSKSLSGLMSTLKDNITMMLAKMGTAASGGAKDLLDAFTQLFQEGAPLERLFTELGPVIGRAFSALADIFMQTQMEIANIQLGWQKLKAMFSGEGITAGVAKNIMFGGLEGVESEIEKHRVGTTASGQGIYNSSAELDALLSVRDAYLATQKAAESYEAFKQRSAGRGPESDSKSPASGGKESGSGTTSGVTAGAKTAAQEYSGYTNQILGAANNMLSGLSDIYAKQSDMEQQRIENMRSMGDALIDYQMNAALKAAGIQEQTKSQQYETEINALNRQIAKTMNVQQKKNLREQVQEKQALKKKSEIEENAAKKKAALDLWIDVQQAKIARKQFLRNQQLQIGMIWMQAGLAVMAAWSGAFTSVSFPPAAAILAAVMTAVILGMAGAQTAVVAAQKPPAFEAGAFISGTPSGMNAIVGERGKSEWILPVDDPRAMARVRDALGIDGGTQIIELNVDGEKMARVVNDRNNRRAARMGATNFSYGSAY
jgi:tape measure domain-containing protein